MFNKKLYGALAIVALFLCAVTTVQNKPVQAQQALENSILFVTPHRVSIAPEEKIELLNVANKSDQKRRYDLQVVNQVMSEDGRTRRVDDFEYSAKKMLRFVPKRFTLEPGERQTVRVMARRSDSLVDGDYHSHLLFREVPLREQDADPASKENAQAGNTSFEIQALYGVAVPIIVQHGNINSTISIESAELKKSENGKPYLQMRFNRTGNAEAAATMTVEHSRAGSANVKIAKDQWVRVYREVGFIEKAFALDVPEGHSLNSGKIKITIANKPLAENGTIIDQKEIKLP